MACQSIKSWKILSLGVMVGVWCGCRDGKWTGIWGTALPQPRPFLFHLFIIAMISLLAVLPPGLPPIKSIICAAARKNIQMCKSGHVTLLLNALSWLLFACRIKPELCLTCKVFHDLSCFPPYPCPFGLSLGSPQGPWYAASPLPFLWETTI